MINPTAGACGVLGKVAKAGDGFARIENICVGAGNCFYIGSRQRRNAAQVLQYIQRRALGSQ